MRVAAVASPPSLLPPTDRRRPPARVFRSSRTRLWRGARAVLPRSNGRVWDLGSTGRSEIGRGALSAPPRAARARVEPGVEGGEEEGGAGRALSP